jgi:hypothetical protein
VTKLLSVRLDQPCCIDEIDAEKHGFFVIPVDDKAHLERG